MPHSNDIEYWAHHYVLVDPRIDDVVKSVFYVGRAVGGSYTSQARYRQHLAQAASGNRSYKCNKIRSIQRDGFDPGFVDLPGCDGDGSMEASLIASYKANGVKLTNMTDGGEGSIGWVPTDVTRSKIANAVRTSSACAAVRAKNLKSLENPEKWLKFSEAIKAAHQRPEVKAKRALVFASLEVKAKQSAASKARWQDEVYRAKRLQALRTAVSTPEYKLAKSAEAKARWKDETYRQKMLQGMRARKPTPEEKARKADKHRRTIFKKRVRNPNYIMSVWLNTCGLQTAQIAKQTGLSWEIVSRYLKRYHDDTANNLFADTYELG